MTSSAHNCSENALIKKNFGLTLYKYLFIKTLNCNKLDNVLCKVMILAYHRNYNNQDAGAHNGSVFNL